MTTIRRLLIVIMLGSLSCCALPHEKTPEQIASEKANEKRLADSALAQKKWEEDIQAQVRFTEALSACASYQDRLPGCDVIEAHEKQEKAALLKRWDEEQKEIKAQDAKKVSSEAEELSKKAGP
jgi:hypothetical protein